MSSNHALKIALIGQSAFAVDVFKRIKQHGHLIVGIFTIPDKGAKEDPLAKCGNENDVPVFKIKSWRKQGKILPEVFEMYRSINADLNVLPYCSQFIPMEVINYPRYQSICYHPSLLPKHRGASSINWTLIAGDKEGGFTIFWADDGLDTGPILLQEKCQIEENDTVDSLYKRFLYPAGVAAVARAVDMVANGTAPREPQTTKDASYDPMLNKEDLQKIDWNKTAQELHNFIRGMDSVPGAMCSLIPPGKAAYENALLFGSSLWKKPKPTGTPIHIQNTTNGLIHEEGLIIYGTDNAMVNVQRVKINGKTKLASTLNKQSEEIEITLTIEETQMVDSIRKIWEAILSLDVEDATDFFTSGAGSMDVVRLVEEIKDLLKVDLANEDVFMNSTFEEFSTKVVLKSRTGQSSNTITYTGVDIKANGLEFKVPTQLFINGSFTDAEDNKTLPTVNPNDESVICNVQCASANDVDKAVKAAEDAFKHGEWKKISAKERGQLLYKLSEVMEQHKEELATLESLDSGAVYTLALKTHVGMSIDVWRYYAGWCDKIQGSTIPIASSRPNNNITFTKREPIG